MTLSRCIGCGFEAEEADGPVHAYLSVSPECWAQFNASMTLHYSDVAYWKAHQLLVDAYTLQHSSGDDRRQIQSAALHLAALVHGIDMPDAGDAQIVRLRKGLSKRQDFPRFDPYPPASTTIAEVAIDAGPDAHEESVCAYGHAVFEDWQMYHGVARDLIAEVLQ